MSDLESVSSTETPSCPKCSGPMWDNREGKRNPKAPDFKCKNKECGGVIWPPRSATTTGAPDASAASGSGAVQPGMPSCPICGGPMWDDRLTKRNPRAPDFKCRNRPKFKGGEGCEGVIWPPREGQKSPYPPPRGAPGAATGGATGGGTATASPRATNAGSVRSAPPPHHDAPPPDDTDFDPSFGGSDDDDLPF